MFYSISCFRCAMADTLPLRNNLTFISLDKIQSRRHAGGHSEREVYREPIYTWRVFYSHFTAVSIYFRMINYSKVFNWQFRLWSLHSCGGQAQPLRLWCWSVLNSHAVFSKSEHFSQKKLPKNVQVYVSSITHLHIYTQQTHTTLDSLI